MMPGIAQAKLDSSGMNARPDSPTCAISRSIRNAARTMYPDASSTRMNANRMTICGRNTITAPTPAMMPSVINERSTVSAMFARTASCSAVKPASIASAGGAAQANTA